MSKEMLKFPKGFLWGGAAAAEQFEGHGNIKKGKTIWDKHFEERPDHFYKGMGPDVTNDFINRYKEDIKLWAEMGSNSVRLGFSWARLFPDGKTLNKEAVEFYHNVIDECKKYNMEPIMTLYHFDMPLWAQELGGFESSIMIDAYAEYADFIFSEYGNKVKYFVTMNEPIVPVICGYMVDIHWPLVKDNKRAFQAGFGTVLCHAKAVNIFNDKYRDKTGGQIGVVINVAPAYAKDGVNFTEADQHAADVNNMLHNYSMLDSMILGKFPEGLKEFAVKHDVLPKYTQEELDEIAKVKIDFIGMNYYGPSRKEEQDKDIKDVHILDLESKHFNWPDARINTFRGWEIYPKAIYDSAKLLETRYNNIPFFISENGMGVQEEWNYRGENGEIQDDYRIAFVQEHLMWLHKAIEEGANAFGYHMWAISDNWSWRNAYRNTYGYVEIDLTDNLKRRYKKSAHWLKETSELNAIPKDFKKIEEFMDLKGAKHSKSF